MTEVIKLTAEERQARRIERPMLDEFMQTVPLPCPVCGKEPDVDECDIPGTGYYAICYSQTPREHCFGVNADTRRAAIVEWNKAIRAATPNKE